MTCSVPRFALAFLVSAVAAAQTASNAFFNDTEVQIVNLTMAPADWQTLQENYLKKTWYHVTLTWNGVISGDAGVRSHGGTGSRSPVKPNLDVDFARYVAGQKYLGLPWVLLKANNQDPSNLREWLAMKLFRKAGLPGPREAPAQVYLNGKLLGLYYLVENIDAGYAQRFLGEGSGYLYEWKYGDSFALNDLGSDPSVYGKYLDLKSGPSTNADLQTFAGFVQAVNRAGLTDSDYVAEISKYISPVLFMTHAAVESIIAEEDGLLGEAGTNNVYVYQFAGTSDYQFLAWDKDRTMKDQARPITEGIASGIVNALAKRLYAIPEHKAVYLGALARLNSMFGAVAGWADAEMTREYNLIHEAALNDTNKQCNIAGIVPEPCGVVEFETAVASMRAYIAQRNAIVETALKGAGYAGPAAGAAIDSVRPDIAGPGEGVCPGALAAIAGSKLGVAARAENLPLPRVLAGVFAVVNGVRAPLLATSPERIEMQIPEDAAIGESDLVVCGPGSVSNTLTFRVLPAAPQIVAVARLNGTVVATRNAPAAGEAIVIYAVGLGTVTPEVESGAAAEPGVTTVAIPRVLLGNAPLEVMYSGLTPGFVGLYQVNVRLPAELPEVAWLPLALSQSGQTATVDLVLR